MKRGVHWDHKKGNLITGPLPGKNNKMAAMIFVVGVVYREINVYFSGIRCYIGKKQKQKQTKQSIGMKEYPFHGHRKQLEIGLPKSGWGWAHSHVILHTPSLGLNVSLAVLS